MWCVSKLDFMMISLRATSKSNKKHSLKRVQRRCKSSFARRESCDQNLINHNLDWSLISCDHNHVRVKNLKKSTHEANVFICFEECFLFDFDVARSEIIIKFSFETHHIVDKWWCCCRRRWRRRDEKIDESVTVLTYLHGISILSPQLLPYIDTSVASSIDRQCRGYIDHPRRTMNNQAFITRLFSSLGFPQQREEK
jgi:hypothetical protein